MNDEQQRIAIATACGWTNLTDNKAMGRGLLGHAPNESYLGLMSVPDYLNDLNALHAAITTWVEETQSPYEKSEREHRFSDALNKVILGKKNGYIRSGYVASAEEWSEAFLRAIGKWVEYHQDEDQDPRCPQCDGTGEGCADGVACSKCKGKGY